MAGEAVVENGQAHEVDVGGAGHNGHGASERKQSMRDRRDTRVHDGYVPKLDVVGQQDYQEKRLTDGSKWAEGKARASNTPILKKATGQNCFNEPESVVRKLSADTVKLLSTHNLQKASFPVYANCSGRKWKLKSLKGLEAVNKNALKNIDCSDNQLTSLEGVDYFPNVVKVRGRDNIINNQTWVKLPNPKMTFLDLAFNQLEAVPDLHLLKQLEFLDLSNNFITDGISSLRKCPKLITLNISFNEFTWNQREFLTNLDKLLKLKHLENIMLEGSPFVAIVDGYDTNVFARLPSLKTLDNLTVSEWLRGEKPEKKKRDKLKQRRSTVAHSDDDEPVGIVYEEPEQIPGPSTAKPNNVEEWLKDNPISPRDNMKDGFGLEGADANGYTGRENGTNGDANGFNSAGSENTNGKPENAFGNSNLEDSAKSPFAYDARDDPPPEVAPANIVNIPTPIENDGPKNYSIREDNEKTDEELMREKQLLQEALAKKQQDMRVYGNMKKGKQASEQARALREEIGGKDSILQQRRQEAAEKAERERQILIENEKMKREMSPEREEKDTFKVLTPEEKSAMTQERNHMSNRGSRQIVGSGVNEGEPSDRQEEPFFSHQEIAKQEKKLERELRNLDSGVDDSAGKKFEILDELQNLKQKNKEVFEKEANDANAARNELAESLYKLAPNTPEAKRLQKDIREQVLAEQRAKSRTSEIHREIARIEAEKEELANESQIGGQNEGGIDAAVAQRETLIHNIGDRLDELRPRKDAEDLSAPEMKEWNFLQTSLKKIETNDASRISQGDMKQLTKMQCLCDNRENVNLSKWNQDEDGSIRGPKNQLLDRDQMAHNVRDHMNQLEDQRNSQAGHKFTPGQQRDWNNLSRAATKLDSGEPLDSQDLSTVVPLKCTCKDGASADVAAPEMSQNVATKRMNDPGSRASDRNKALNQIANDRGEVIPDAIVLHNLDDNLAQLAITEKKDGLNRSDQRKWNTLVSARSKLLERGEGFLNSEERDALAACQCLCDTLRAGDDIDPNDWKLNERGDLVGKNGDIIPKEELLHNIEDRLSRIPLEETGKGGLEEQCLKSLANKIRNADKNPKLSSDEVSFAVPLKCTCGVPYDFDGPKDEEFSRGQAIHNVNDRLGQLRDLGNLDSNEKREEAQLKALLVKLEKNSPLSDKDMTDLGGMTCLCVSENLNKSLKDRGAKHGGENVENLRHNMADHLDRLRKSEQSRSLSPSERAQADELQQAISKIRSGQGLTPTEKESFRGLDCLCGQAGSNKGRWQMTPDGNFVGPSGQVITRDQMKHNLLDNINDLRNEGTTDNHRQAKKNVELASALQDVYDKLERKPNDPRSALNEEEMALAVPLKCTCRDRGPVAGDYIAVWRHNVEDRMKDLMKKRESMTPQEREEYESLAAILTKLKNGKALGDNDERLVRGLKCTCGASEHQMRLADRAAALAKSNDMKGPKKQVLDSDEAGQKDTGSSVGDQLIAGDKDNTKRMMGTRNDFISPNGEKLDPRDVIHNLQDNIRALEASSKRRLSFRGDGHYLSKVERDNLNKWKDILGKMESRVLLQDMERDAAAALQCLCKEQEAKEWLLHRIEDNVAYMKRYRESPVRNMKLTLDDLEELQDKVKDDTGPTKRDRPLCETLKCLCDKDEIAAKAAGRLEDLNGKKRLTEEEKEEKERLTNLLGKLEKGGELDSEDYAVVPSSKDDTFARRDNWNRDDRARNRVSYMDQQELDRLYDRLYAIDRTDELKKKKNRLSVGEKEELKRLQDTRDKRTKQEVEKRIGEIERFAYADQDEDKSAKGTKSGSSRELADRLENEDKSAKGTKSGSSRELADRLAELEGKGRLTRVEKEELQDLRDAQDRKDMQDRIDELARKNVLSELEKKELERLRNLQSKKALSDEGINDRIAELGKKDRLTSAEEAELRKLKGIKEDRMTGKEISRRISELENKGKLSKAEKQELKRLQARQDDKAIEDRIDELEGKARLTKEEEKELRHLKKVEDNTIDENDLEDRIEELQKKDRLTKAEKAELRKLKEEKKCAEEAEEKRYKAVNSRINELANKGSLSEREKDELDRLQSEKDDLDMQSAIREIEKKRMPTKADRKELNRLKDQEVKNMTVEEAKERQDELQKKGRLSKAEKEELERLQKRADEEILLNRIDELQGKRRLTPEEEDELDRLQQMVYNKMSEREMEDRIAELEKKGRLSKAEKAELRKLQDMKEGDMTDKEISRRISELENKGKLSKAEKQELKRLQARQDDKAIEDRIDELEGKARLTKEEKEELERLKDMDENRLTNREIQDRINDLQDKDSLTKAEKAELRKLQDANDKNMSEAKIKSRVKDLESKGRLSKAERAELKRLKSRLDTIEEEVQEQKEEEDYQRRLDAAGKIQQAIDDLEAQGEDNMSKRDRERRKELAKIKDKIIAGEALNEDEKSSMDRMRNRRRDVAMITYRIHELDNQNSLTPQEQREKNLLTSAKSKILRNGELTEPEEEAVENLRNRRQRIKDAQKRMDELRSKGRLTTQEKKELEVLESAEEKLRSNDELSEEEKFAVRKANAIEGRINELQKKKRRTKAEQKELDNLVSAADKMAADQNNLSKEEKNALEKLNEKLNGERALADHIEGLEKKRREGRITKAEEAELEKLNEILDALRDGDDLAVQDEDFLHMLLGDGYQKQDREEKPSAVHLIKDRLRTIGSVENASRSVQKEARNLNSALEKLKAGKDTLSYAESTLLSQLECSCISRAAMKHRVRDCSRGLYEKEKLIGKLDSQEVANKTTAARIGNKLDRGVSLTEDEHDFIAGLVCTCDVEAMIHNVDDRLRALNAKNTLSHFEKKELEFLANIRNTLVSTGMENTSESDWEILGQLTCTCHQKSVRPAANTDVVTQGEDEQYFREQELLAQERLDNERRKARQDASDRGQDGRGSKSGNTNKGGSSSGHQGDGMNMSLDDGNELHNAVDDSDRFEEEMLTLVKNKAGVKGTATLVESDRLRNTSSSTKSEMAKSEAGHGNSMMMMQMDDSNEAFSAQDGDMLGPDGKYDYSKMSNEELENLLSLLTERLDSLDRAVKRDEGEVNQLKNEADTLESSLRNDAGRTEAATGDVEVANEENEIAAHSVARSLEEKQLLDEETSKMKKETDEYKKKLKDNGIVFDPNEVLVNEAVKLKAKLKNHKDDTARVERQMSNDGEEMVEYDKLMQGLKESEDDLIRDLPQQNVQLRDLKEEQQYLSARTKVLSDQNERMDQEIVDATGGESGKKEKRKPLREDAVLKPLFERKEELLANPRLSGDDEAEVTAVTRQIINSLTKRRNELLKERDSDGLSEQRSEDLAEATVLLHNLLQEEDSRLSKKKENGTLENETLRFVLAEGANLTLLKRDSPTPPPIPPPRPKPGVQVKRSQPMAATSVRLSVDKGERLSWGSDTVKEKDPTWNQKATISLDQNGYRGRGKSTISIDVIDEAASARSSIGAIEIPVREIYKIFSAGTESMWIQVANDPKDSLSYSSQKSRDRTKPELLMKMRVDNEVMSLTAVQRQLKALEEEIRREKEAIDAVRQKRKKNDQVEAVVNDCCDVNGELQNLRSRAAAMGSHSTEDSVESLRTQIEQVEEQLRVVRGSKAGDSLEDQVREMEAAVEALKRRIKELEEKIEELEDDLLEAEDAAESKKELLQVARPIAQKLSAEQYRVEDKTEGLQSELSALQKYLAAVKPVLQRHK